MFSTIKLSLMVLLGTLIAIAGVSSHLAAAQDNHPLQDHYLLDNDCSELINEQISWELYASIVYLNMGAYFDKPIVARNGYAKYFKDQSLEEYGHATKLIDYINSRNSTLKRITVDESTKAEWSSPKEALADAIKLEKHVYAKLQYLHDVADQKCQDAHLMDFLETYYFVEQVESISELQMMLTKISVEDPSAAHVIEHITDERLKKSNKADL